ncbi:MAG: phosphoribosylformylglycinamidine cyclo-ligase [bacterium]|nr:phosphoribosylformylglycinamidine cyclo-ligase [bacterium]
MIDYEKSGVSLGRASASKSRIAAAARSTFGPRVLTDVGHFGGFFALSEQPESDVLVASTDGVGTKLLLGVQLDRIKGLGADLVQHCINDILMCGARPLFFLDYMAFGKLDPDVAATLAESLASACRAHGVALIGGETAEMPDLYAPGHFDLAGTIVGIVARADILDGRRVRKGDVLLGVASDGLHTNGYSLARRVFAEETASGALKSMCLADGRSLAEALMQPHRCYLSSLGSLIGKPWLHALSHITGGGLEANTLRVIPDGLSLEVDYDSWPRPELFRLIQRRGTIDEMEMRRVFNLGIGAVAIVDPAFADAARDELVDRGEHVFSVGHIA